MMETIDVIAQYHSIHDIHKRTELLSDLFQLMFNEQIKTAMDEETLIGFLFVFEFMAI